MKCFFILLLALVGQCTSGPWDSSPRCPPVLFPNGKVRARGRGKIIRFNCFEGFTLVGNRYSTCVRGSWDTPKPVCVNSQCPTIATPEHALVASKYNGAIMMFFCEPGYMLIGTAEIYCNGRQWNSSTPFCRDTAAAASTACDFEKPDLCWWEQDPTHDFDWRRHNFETPSSHIGTGPTHDHTLGAGNDGYYLYIEASGRLVNDTARIISPLYNASLTNSGCFSFWYHMYGATIGALKVYMKLEGQLPKLMFEKHGNQGNQWLRGLFDLPSTNISFQIMIEGVRGASYVSDLAIDDVAILQNDECVEARKSDVGTTLIIPTNNDDQIEIVNALQSCRGRCGDVAETGTTIIPLSSPDACHCNLECAENSTCCPDFAEYCILAVTDTPYTSLSTRETASSSRSHSAVSPAGNPNSDAQISIEPKDDIDPDASKPPVPVTPIEPKLSTKSISSKTITGKVVVHIETPFAAQSISSTVTRKFIRPSLKTISTVSSTESHVLVEHVQELSPAPSLGISEIISIIVVLIVVAMIGTVVAVVIVRRKKSYKRGSGAGNGSILSEDSDVRFLTSDEVLDFNLARPNDYDEL